MRAAGKARWRISRQVAYELVQEEAVALDLKSGLYFKLNQVAACTLDGLARGLDHGDLEDCLLRKFDVDPATLHRDLIALLADLEKYGLIVRDARDEAEPVSFGVTMATDDE